MKHLLVLLFLFAHSHAVSQKFIEKTMENLQVIGQDCAFEVSATADDITQLIEGIIPSSHTGQCLVFCMQQNLHLMKKDGSADPVGSVLALDDLREDDFEAFKKMLEIFVSCEKEVERSDDPCVTAAELASCGQREMRAKGLNDMMVG